jgi:hypothetical protein
MSYGTISDGFGYRENIVVAENSQFPFNLLRKFYSGLPYGHGLSPLYIILITVAVIVIFAVFYLILTLLKKIRSGIYIPANMQVSKKGRKRLISLNFNRGKIVFDCLLFSAVSLISLGYSTIYPKRRLSLYGLLIFKYRALRLVKVLSGIEALIGTYIIVLFIMTVFK